MRTNKKCRIDFRCSEDEFRKIKQDAENCGLTVSTYCNNVLMGNRPKQRLTQEQLRLLTQVRLFTTNMQRIANFFHAGKYESVMAEVRVIVAQLKQLLYDCHS